METSLWSAHGRITRKTYWLRVLYCVIITFVIGVLQIVPVVGTFLSFIGSFAISIFMIIQGIKRMHDVGKSGWFLLIPIYNFILAVSRSR